MTKSLHTTEDIANLSVALYMISMSIFPLWWSSFSEQFGRRSIYIISFALFLVFAVLSAVSTNVAMLIVFRILTGGASASVQAVGAGTIADIWESRERGRAMSTFYLGPLLAPLIAPIVGGALAQGFGWKATMWFLAIYGLAILLLLVFCLPETLARRPKIEEEENPALESSIRRMTTAESAKVRTRNLAASAKRIFIDPLSVLLFLRFPPVFITVFTAAIAFGALFISNISIQQKFSQPPYNFSEIIIGLMYIPAGLGYFVASILGGRWIDKIMARQAIKANRYDENGKLVYLPEDRFRENMWLANTMYPIGLLIYGWTLNYGVIFIVPAIGSFIFGAASMLVFVSPSFAPFTPSPFPHRNDQCSHPCSPPPPRCSRNSSAKRAPRASPSTTLSATSSAAWASLWRPPGSMPWASAGSLPLWPSSACWRASSASGR
jgi:multidrug resistance protein